MFNLIAKAKDAGYQLWINAAKVLTITTGIGSSLTVIKTVTDISPSLLVAELSFLGFTSTPDNSFFCWMDLNGALWAVDNHNLYSGSKGEHGICWHDVYSHNLRISTPEQASVMFKIPQIGRITASLIYSSGYTSDWVLPSFIDFSGETEHETILSWLSEVGIRKAGMHLEDVEFISFDENPDAYISI